MQDFLKNNIPEFTTFQGLIKRNDQKRMVEVEELRKLRDENKQMK